MYLGLMGLVLLAIGWIPEVLAIIREKKSRINTKFGTLYVLGSLFLFMYSLQIKDYIFMILNFFVMIMSAISLWYSLKKK